MQRRKRMTHNCISIANHTERKRYMATSITIVVADQHPIMRAGILSVLREVTDLHVIGEASDGAQAIDMCREVHPDVLMLDIHMANLEELMVAYQLSNTYQAPRIMLLSTISNADVVQAALDAGVSGYILKDVTGNNLRQAIYRVA